MAEFSSELRAQIVILHSQNWSQRRIAAFFNVSKTGVYKTIKRYENTKDYRSLKRSGRPKVTTTRTDRIIRRLAVSHPEWPASRIRNELSFMRPLPSVDTICRRLRLKFGLKSRIAACKPLLSKKNIRDRKVFCEKFRSWTNEMWSTVMFSDETIIRQFSRAVIRVRRPVGKRYCLRYVRPSVKNCPQVMIWGAISSKGRAAISFVPPGKTMDAKRYLSILKDKLPDHMSIHRCDYFQHDGAPCHRAKLVSDWIERSGFQVLQPWPGSSPDLNPIENCWSVLKKKVRCKFSNSLEDLKKNILKVWTREISPDFCKSLIDSMPRRISQVLANRGQSSKY